jgi:hypothetical protein
VLTRGYCVVACGAGEWKTSGFAIAGSATIFVVNTTAAAAATGRVQRNRARLLIPMAWSPAPQPDAPGAAAPSIVDNHGQMYQRESRL